MQAVRRGRALGALLFASLFAGTLIAFAILIVIRLQRDEPAPTPSLTPDPTSTESAIPADDKAAVSQQPPAATAAFSPDEQVSLRLIALDARGDAAARQAARARADELLARVRAGEDFAALAREHSTHHSREQGGQLMRMTMGMLPSELASQIAALAIGDATVIEQGEEYYLFQRVQPPPILACQQIVVRFREGAASGGGGDDETPDREAARAIAEEALALARAPGADFSELVGRFSQDASAMNGGIIGPFSAETMTIPGFADALIALEIGEIASTVLETQDAFYVLRRVALEETEPPVPPDDPPPEPSAPADPARIPPASLAGRAPAARATGAFLLITWAGAERANMRIKRDQQAALARAEAVIKIARSVGADFRELVKSYSEDPGFAAGGGSTGILTPDRLPAPWMNQLLLVEPGVVIGPIETPRGYIVMQREELEEVALRDIVITFKGARNASQSLERTSEEAQAMVEAAHARIVAGESFADVAGEVSDQRRGSRGAVGVLERRSPFFQNYPGYEERAFALAVGETSGVFSTEWGWHLIHREEVLAGRHIRVAFAGKAGVPPAVRQRTREEAMALATSALAELESGASFADVARRFSDDLDRERGGDMGVFGAGQRPEVVVAAVAALAPGARSGVVETPHGLEIFERY